MNEQLKVYAKQTTGDVVVQIKDACERGGNYTEAYPTGFPSLDESMQVAGETTGGFRDGDLVVVTGRSGCGKTTFAQNLTVRAEQAGFANLWFSYEVSVNNLYAKFKEMGMNERSGIYTPKKNVSGSVGWIADKIKEAKNNFMIKMVVIDHLDFLSPANKDTGDQFRMVLRNTCQELKTLAINEEVIIILMAHIRKTREAQVAMEDIAESAGIYQLADYVYAIERDEIETPTVGGGSESIPSNQGRIRTLKNRLTGKQPVMLFHLENNIIKPL